MALGSKATRSKIGTMVDVTSLYSELKEDLHAALRNDPAARSALEVALI